MFGLAALFLLFAVGGGLFLLLALVALVLKVVFRVVLLPVALVGGLLKLVLLPILGIVVLVVLGPILLTVGAVILVPLLLVGGVLALAWGAFHLVFV